MRDDVRVRRDWIDVRHEFLQGDGRWVAGMCDKEDGFCRECNRDGERQPHQALRHAFSAGRHPHRAAQIVIASHLYIRADDVVDGLPIVATEFRRLSIAFHLQIIGGLPIDDGAVLSAKTAGDLFALALAPEEREAAR